MNKILHTWECYPDRAQYIEKQKQTVTLMIETDLDEDLNKEKIYVKLYRLSDTVKIIADLLWNSLNDRQYARAETGIWDIGGYGAEVIYNNEVVCSTAFDVVSDYKDNIRYGFLSRFTKKDIGTEDVLFANKLHISILQFYDWMYRYDTLVPPQENYKNPMGCEISGKAIHVKIEACYQYGIRPYAYGAVYAVGKDFYESHKEWALYKLDKTPLIFADWLVYMNIAGDSGWNAHIKNQFKEAVKQFNFLGIHMDTYGFPKTCRDYEGNIINLAEDFPKLIDQTRETIKGVNPDAGVIFNAVNDWPVETVALAGQDGVYIEVWPPHDTYRDLYLLIQKAHQISGKNVILAAYIKPFAEAMSDEDFMEAEHACLLAFAVIHAAGGHQLVFGENGGALYEGYYVNYARMRDAFLPAVRSYCDFIVRYSELLYTKAALDVSMTAAGGINEDITFSCADESIGFSSCGEGNKIWCMIKEWSHYIIISMINLIDSDDQWNEKKSKSITEVSDIKLRVLMEKEIKGVYYSTPDERDCAVHELEYRTDSNHMGRFIEVTVPSLLIWDYLWIDFSEEGE